MKIHGKNILITGGTGSFGKKFTDLVLKEHHPRRLVIYSRDELKQSDMAADPRFTGDQRLRYFIGDVRDKDRLARALDGVDFVVHAAAMKQVPAAEYNPFEAVKTNIIGAQNLIDCAIDKGVKKVIALSTDKAANPVNLYGATKLCSDKLFVSGNSYTGPHPTAFSVVRYGNVVGSRGSVVPLFLRQRKSGVLPITDERMTRFWITLEQGVRFVIQSLKDAQGGELFVPKIPSMKVVDVAHVIAPRATLRIIGIRSGEKLHEALLPADDARLAVEQEDRFVLPGARREYWSGRGKTCREGFAYESHTNAEWLDSSSLREIIEGLDLAEAKLWTEEMAAADLGRDTR